MHKPFVFYINGDTRSCVDVRIIEDRVRAERDEVFLLRLTSTDTPMFTDEAIVVIQDQGLSINFAPY